MKVFVYTLLILAAAAFLCGTLARFLTGGILLGNDAVVFWRGAMGFLMFATVLLLLQIAERK